MSVALSLPGLAGLACEDSEHAASETSAIAALSGASHGDSNAVTGEASFDGLAPNADAPELQGFVKAAKAQAESDRDLDAIHRDPNLR